MMEATDRIRAFMIDNGVPAKDLASHGQDEPTWTTAELTRDFEVTGFAAPFVVVRRKSDDQVGSLEFTGQPRVYFGWTPDE